MAAPQPSTSGRPFWTCNVGADDDANAKADVVCDLDRAWPPFLAASGTANNRARPSRNGDRARLQCDEFELSRPTARGMAGQSRVPLAQLPAECGNLIRRCALTGARLPQRFDELDQWAASANEVAHNTALGARRPACLEGATGAPSSRYFHSVRLGRSAGGIWCLLPSWGGPIACTARVP